MQRHWYKIVERDDEQIKSLFHGNRGSRKLNTNEWMEAEMKHVSDGFNGTVYISGWHIAPSFQECKKYLKYFKKLKNKAIVKCEAMNIWPKTHSRHNIHLAQWIKILEVKTEL